jgi:ABC-2 type transport system ATP-binding protein
MKVIEAKNLGKSFRTKVKAEGLRGSLASVLRPEYRMVDAVDDLSFTVERGEFLAFIGPNGAGKSTTIKMLTGIMQPSAGTASVLGLDPARQRKALCYKIGSVFGQKSQLWFHLPAQDSFNLLGAIYEIDRKELARRRDRLVERFGIGDYVDVPVRKLSLGQRIRCEVAASLLHEPEIVFLDEPTIGLDVVAKQELRELLRGMNEDGKVTVFLTSHDPGDIEKVCKRAIIVHHGSIVLDQSVKELKHSNLNRKIVSVKFAARTRVDIPGAKQLKATEFAVKLEVDTRAIRIADVVQRLVAAGEVLDLSIEDEPLENIIADIYRSRSLEEAHARAQG